VYRGYRSRKKILKFSLIKKFALQLENIYWKKREIKRKKFKEIKTNYELGALELIKLLQGF
jgi:hypothetical protein